MTTRIAVGGLVASRYRLVRELGHGGMGVVYVATDETLGRSVAVKILHPTLTSVDFLARFEREAAVLAKLRSPHIVTIHDHGRVDDLTFLVTELFADGDLQSWVKTHGPLPVRDALDVCAQVAEALADAHEQGVIHRDVKPANVLVWQRQGRLRAHLGDFGIAQDGSAGLTATGGVLGSLAYMAPERHLGATADGRGDIYSLGCLLHSVLTGAAPYSGTDFQLMNAHIHEPIPQLGPETPHAQELNALLQRCLAKDPKDRFQTAPALRQEIERVLMGLPGHTGAAAQPGGAPASGAGLVTGSGVSVPAPASGEWTELRPAPDETVMKSGGVAEAAAREPRRWGRLLVLGLLALVLAVSGGVVMATQLGDTPPPVEADTPAVPAPPPAPVPAPDVAASPTYRGVHFEADLPGASQAALSVRGDGRWRTLEAPKLRIKVPVGGERACATFRLEDVATGRTGPSTRVCGKARQPTVRLVRDDVKCRGCGRFDVQVTGFRSGARLPVTFLGLNGDNLCPDACRGHYVLVDKSGRGTMFNSDGDPGFVQIVQTYTTPFDVRLGKGFTTRLRAWK